MLTPQQLMDLPGAGSAEKQLRKEGRWSVTVTDTERLDWIALNTVSARCDFVTWEFKLGCTEVDPEFIREDIDNAATHKEMIQ